MSRKKVIRPTTALYPVPAVLVTSCSEGMKPNIITIAWTGVMNSEPPVVYVGVRPGRHSHKLIKKSGDYCINIPSAEQVKILDYCGMVSGSKVDKFARTGLTPLPADFVTAPLIEQCPVNLECRVINSMFLGTHEIFIAEVMALHVNEDILKENGSINAGSLQSFGYCQGEYRTVGEKIGSHGFSIK